MQVAPQQMFVHDFVHVDRPLADIVGRFGPLADPWLGALVVAAWADIREEWAAAGVDPTELIVSSGLRVSLGMPRFRDDGLIIPITWPPGERRFVPGIEADLELASFGPRRTHVQLLGRYRFPPGIDRWSREGSVAHRITVAGVRRFLQLLAGQLENPGSGGSPPTAGSDRTNMPATARRRGGFGTTITGSGGTPRGSADKLPLTSYERVDPDASPDGTDGVSMQ